MNYPRKSRLLLALLISAVVLGAMFFLCRKCMPLWLVFDGVRWRFPLWSAAVILILPSICVFAFLVMEWKSRLVLVVCTVIIVSVAWLAIPDRHLIPIPALEASAVKSLVQARAALMSERSNNNALGFADMLSNTQSVFPVRRYYDFNYRPRSLPAGRIGQFEIAATLKSGARECGCSRNFVIDAVGVMHYTTQSRSATSTDPALEVPPALDTAER